MGKGRLRPSPYRVAREELLSGNTATRVQAMADLEAAIRADQKRLDAAESLAAAKQAVRADGDLVRVESAVDGLVAAVRSATWRLARAVVEEEIQEFGPRALLRQALLSRMERVERHQADA